MALVVIMGFLISGIQSGASRDAGFATEGLSVLSLDLVRDGYSLDEAAGVLAGLPERLTESDNVEAAALMDSRLFQQFVLPDTTASIPADRAAAETIQRVAVQTIGPGFFATLGVSVQRGAEFSNRDVALRCRGAARRFRPSSITRPRSSSASRSSGKDLPARREGPPGHGGREVRVAATVSGLVRLPRSSFP